MNLPERFPPDDPREWMNRAGCLLRSWQHVYLPLLEMGRTRKIARVDRQISHKWS